MTAPSAREERRAALRDRVLSATRAGKSAAEIGVAEGISKRSVQRIRHELGIARPLAATPWSQRELDMAAALLEDGCPYAEVARTLGRHVSSVRKHFPGRGWTREQTVEYRHYHYKEVLAS